MALYKLCVFVPDTHAEAVKQALFDAGAGRVGDYDHCAFELVGQGQFRPLPGSQPFLGSTGRVERVTEHRIELVCDQRYLAAALRALVAAHPYQEPAVDLWPLLDYRQFL